MINIKDIIPALQRASAKDTCWPGCRQLWTPDNPAWGHCVMYTLYAHEFYDDVKIIFVEALLPDGTVIPHYMIHIDGEDIDLSSSQFEEGTTFRNRKNVIRKHVLSLSDGEAKRYKVFRQRMFRCLLET